MQVLSVEQSARLQAAGRTVIPDPVILCWLMLSGTNPGLPAHVPPPMLRTDASSIRPAPRPSGGNLAAALRASCARAPLQTSDWPQLAGSQSACVPLTAAVPIMCKGTDIQSQITPATRQLSGNGTPQV